MSERKFLDMTPRQFFARLNAQRDRDRQQAELARIMSFLIAGSSGNMKKGITLRKFWPLPWDNDKVVKFEPQSPEERKAFEEKAKRVFQHIKSKNANGIQS